MIENKSDTDNFKIKKLRGKNLHAFNLKEETI